MSDDPHADRRARLVTMRERATLVGARLMRAVGGHLAHVLAPGATKALCGFEPGLVRITGRTHRSTSRGEWAGEAGVYAHPCRGCEPLLSIRWNRAMRAMKP